MYIPYERAYVYTICKSICIYHMKEQELKILPILIHEIFAYRFTYYDIISEVTIFQYETPFTLDLPAKNTKLMFMYV